MRHIFDGEEEMVVFAEFAARNINEQINKIREEIAIEPIIEVTSKMVIEMINLYEN